VLLALSRFGERIERVTVRVAEADNPLGGLDRRCRTRAWLQSGECVRAEVVNGRIDNAAGRAVARLADRVAFALDGGFHPALCPLPSAARPRRRTQGR
jgi:hypothetical protein